MQSQIMTPSKYRAPLATTTAREQLATSVQKSAAESLLTLSRSPVIQNLPPAIFTLMKSTEPWSDEYYLMDFEAVWRMLALRRLLGKRQPCRRF